MSHAPQSPTALLQAWGSGDQAALDELVPLVHEELRRLARRFMGRYGNPFAAVGADANGRASIDWGVYGVPETFVIGRDGRVAYKLVGPITAENLETVLKPQLEKALAASP